MTFFEMVAEQFQAIHWIEFCARILLAAIVGCLIGYERSNRFKDAGVRTHCIICCTAATLIVLSKYGFTDLSNLDGSLYFPGIKGADPARIASSAVSGASFLGVGIIYRDKGYLTRGLTTAAGVWSACAVGLCIGSGFIGIGLFTAAVIMCMKYVVHKFAIGGAPTVEVTINIVLHQPDQTPEALCEGMKKMNMVIQETTMTSCTADEMHFELEMKMKQDTNVSEVRDLAAQYGDVQSVRIIHES